MNHLYVPLAIKSGATKSDGTFEGYGAVFGNTDSYGDVIAKGAFTETLATRAKSGAWPQMLLQHGGMGRGATGDEMPIGIWTGLAEDDHGLKVEGKIALGTTRGKDIFELMTMEPRPAISGLSIGYRATKFTNGKTKSEPLRTLQAVDLVECSIVTSPANDLARISGVKGELPTERELEHILRDAGFSAQQAKAIVAGGHKALKSKRDAALSEDDWIAEFQKLTNSLQSK